METGKSRHIAEAMRIAGLDPDERGLVPLDEAREIVARWDVETVKEADRLWAALLSLESGVELAERAQRFDWGFQVRGRENIALVDRYGAELLEWLKTRVRSGTIYDEP